MDREARGEDVKPNESLIFEIQIVDVMTAEQYRKQMETQSRLMQQQQMQQQPQSREQPK